MLELAYKSLYAKWCGKMLELEKKSKKSITLPISVLNKSRSRKLYQKNIQAQSWERVGDIWYQCDDIKSVALVLKICVCPILLFMSRHWQKGTNVLRNRKYNGYISASSGS